VTTQHLPARPIGSGDPIYTPADSTLLKPAECDFRADDLKVTELTARFEQEVLPLRNILYRNAFRMSRNHADAGLRRRSCAPPKTRR
jgi:hypothetical protein